LKKTNETNAKKFHVHRAAEDHQTPGFSAQGDLIAILPWLVKSHPKQSHFIGIFWEIVIVLMGKPACQSSISMIFYVPASFHSYVKQPAS
jgi:hypothetical protein